ncbi:MAG: hypothetical protein PQJ28_03550 [Spirochaetales bacterium]|nr:hypothetical protein [Spirochaetales bacterium]
MAEDDAKTPPTSDGDAESLRQHNEALAAEQAQQSADDAEKLKAEEYPVQQLVTGGEETPFGNRKDDEKLLSENSVGVAAARTDTPSGQPAPVSDAAERADAPSAVSTQIVEEGAENVESFITASPAIEPTEPSSSSVTIPGTVLDEASAQVTEEVSGSFATVEPPEASAIAQPIPAPLLADEGPPPEAQPPVLSVVAAQGQEDSSIALSINAALADTDNGAETLSLLISGVPEGAVLSAGVNLGDGVWRLTPGQLNGLTFTPPPNASGDVDLVVTAISTEQNGSTSSTTQTLSIDIVGVADAPLLSVSFGSGNEDASVPLEITGTLVDTDGSETLQYLVESVPEGAVLSAGTNNGDGTWTLSADDLSNLTFTPPLNFSGTIQLSVSDIAT